MDYNKHISKELPLAAPQDGKEFTATIKVDKQQIEQLRLEVQQLKEIYSR